MDVQRWNDVIRADFPYAVNLTVVEYMNRDIDDDANISTVSGQFYVEDVEGDVCLYVEDAFSDKTFILPNIETYEELPDSAAGVKRRVVTNDEGRRYVLTSNVSDEFIERAKNA
jgi:hypothetical protein